MPQQPKQQRQPKDDFSELQELFSDVFGTHINPWSAAITFGQRATRPEDDNHYTIRMRMPLQQAKALAVMLLRNIRQYERQMKVEIELPKVVLDGLGIAADDWKRFSLGDDDDDGSS